MVYSSNSNDSIRLPAPAVPAVLVSSSTSTAIVGTPLSFKISIPKPKSKLNRGKSVGSTNTNETDPTTICSGSSRSFSITSNPSIGETSNSSTYIPNNTTSSSPSVAAKGSRTKLLLATKSKSTDTTSNRNRSLQNDSTNGCTTPKVPDTVSSSSLLLTTTKNENVSTPKEQQQCDNDCPNTTVLQDKRLRSNKLVVDSETNIVPRITSASQLRDAAKRRRGSIDTSTEYKGPTSSSVACNARWNTVTSTGSDTPIQIHTPTTPTSTSRHRRKVIVPTSCLVNIETEAIKSINSNKIIKEKEIELPGFNKPSLSLKTTTTMGRYENELSSHKNSSSSNNDNRRKPSSSSSSSAASTSISTRPSSFHYHDETEDDIICSAASLSRKLISDTYNSQNNTNDTKDIVVTIPAPTSKRNTIAEKGSIGNEYVLKGLLGSLTTSASVSTTASSSPRKKKIYSKVDGSIQFVSTNIDSKAGISSGNSQSIHVKDSVTINSSVQHQEQTVDGCKRKLLKKRIEPKLLNDIQLKSAINNLLTKNSIDSTTTNISPSSFGTTSTGTQAINAGDNDAPSYSSFVIRHPRKAKMISSLSPKSIKSQSSSNNNKSTSTILSAYTTYTDDSTSITDKDCDVCDNSTAGCGDCTDNDCDKNIDTTCDDDDVDVDASWYVDEQDRRQQLRRQVAMCGMHNNNTTTSKCCNNNNYRTTIGTNNNNNNSQRKLKRLVKQKSKYLSTTKTIMDTDNNTSCVAVDDTTTTFVKDKQRVLRSRKAVLRVLSGHQSTFLLNNLQQAADASSSSSSSSLEEEL